MISRVLLEQRVAIAFFLFSYQTPVLDLMYLCSWEPQSDFVQCNLCNPAWRLSTTIIEIGLEVNLHEDEERSMQKLGVSRLTVEAHSNF